MKKKNIKWILPIALFSAILICGMICVFLFAMLFFGAVYEEPQEQEAQSPSKEVYGYLTALCEFDLPSLERIYEYTDANAEFMYYIGDEAYVVRRFRFVNDGTMERDEILSAAEIHARAVDELTQSGNTEVYVGNGEGAELFFGEEQYTEPLVWTVCFYKNLTNEEMNTVP